MSAKDLLKDKDKKFRLLFEDHPQPMWVVDEATGKFLEANGAACELYGYTPDEFRAKSLHELEVPEEPQTPAGTPAAPPGVTIWRHRSRPGGTIEVEAAVHDIQYGGTTAQLAVLLDITGRRHLEEQLRQVAAPRD